MIGTDLAAPNAGPQGYVRDVSGKPIEGASVYGYIDASVLATRLTDERGFFKFESVRPGTYYIRAKANGYMVSGSDVQVQKNSVASVDFVLRRGECLLKGRVVDDDGRPVEAELYLYRSGIMVMKAKSLPSNGALTFDDLTEGEYELSAYSECHETRSWSGMVKGKTRFSLRLPSTEGCASKGKCDVCGQIKEVRYCRFCHAFICNDCRHNLPERIKAMIRRRLAKKDRSTDRIDLEYEKLLSDRQNCAGCR